jgi:hypothetical protein
VFSGVVAFLAFDRFGDSLLTDLLGNGDSAAVTPLPVERRQFAVGPSATDEEVVIAEEEQSIDGDEAEATTQGEAVEGELAQSQPVDGESVEGEAVEGEAAEGDDAEAAQAVPVVEPPNPADDGPKMAPAPPRKSRVRRSPRPKAVAAAPKGDSLSAADQKVIEDFGSSADTAPAKIDVEKSGSTQSKNPPLDGDGVRATVTTNKPRLQRCYERAIRGQQSPPSVRLDLTVTVAASGRVKAVDATGSAPGGLAECVEASVRRWRFPASAEGGPAKFPIVFSAN